MLNVLYLDKDASPLEPVKVLLEMTADMKVDVARTVDEGISRLTGGGVDLIIMGCREGDRGFLSFLRRLRSEGNQTPLVVLADAFNEDIRDETEKSANSAYLSKEKNTTNLLMLLTEAVNSLTGGVTG